MISVKTSIAVTNPTVVAYDASGTTQVTINGYSDFFDNSEPTNCPWNLCNVKSKGNCGSGTSGDTSKVTRVANSSPWHFKAINNVAAGWTKDVCIFCETVS